MNGSSECHEIEGVPGLYVDAFRGAYLKKTAHKHNAFILTHYHGDHYGSLPRDNKYNGPALIHCTPITASLLRHVHQIPSSLVVEHPYGVTWTYKYNNSSSSCSSCSSKFHANNNNSNSSQVNKGGSSDQEEVKITFYDANHCPGAAIVTIQKPDGVLMVHTGDMRYHPKMKSYPVLQRAVQNRKLDLLYLDTTYGHPKHDFVPQNVAVNTIATQIHDILSSHDQIGRPPPKTVINNDPNNNTKPKVLILLSCYSIGKEKVLWETSQRTNQLIYVTEKKLKMMECIRGPEQQQDTTAAQTNPQQQQQQEDTCIHQRIVERCTRDPNATDIHVIRMGLAGELWPYFRPNYRNCVDYLEEEELTTTRNYDKVVAFIPTGWANGSNWNKKNASCKRQLECRKTKGRRVDVEIRLISYSEHSTYQELEEFVKYCRPRKVIPTVFSDANDRRRMEKLFRNYIDTSRAKLQFFKGMQTTRTKTTSTPACGGATMESSPTAATTVTPSKGHDNSNSKLRQPPESQPSNNIQNSDENDEKKPAAKVSISDNKPSAVTAVFKALPKRDTQQTRSDDPSPGNSEEEVAERNKAPHETTTTTTTTNASGGPSNKKREMGSNDCIDLTLSSDDEQEENEKQDNAADQRSKIDASISVNSNKLSPTVANPSSSSACCSGSPNSKTSPPAKHRSPPKKTTTTPTKTPAKRKKESGSSASAKTKKKNVATPPITQFFAVKTKR